MNSLFFRAIAILVGTTIGAGIFAIPYAFSQVGFGLGLAYLFILSLVILILNLCYSEVILRTPGDHQLTGYGEIYLGKIGKILGVLALLTAIYGALLAYIIQVGNFLGLLFNLSELSFVFSLIFFCVSAVLVFLGLRLISKIELIMVGLLICLIVTIAVFGFSQLTPSHFQIINYQLSIINFFLPYGILLFALSGSSVIPEVEEILRSQPKKLKKAVVWGTLIPTVVYLLFAAVIVGVTGALTSPDAISGLAQLLPSIVVKIGALLGVLAMSTSFLTLGFVLREMYFRDFKLHRIFSWFLSVFPPLFLFLFGSKNFISVLKTTGTLMGGLTGILIMALFLKARKIGKLQPDFTVPLPTAAAYLISLVFLLGIFYSLWQIF